MHSVVRSVVHPVVHTAVLVLVLVLMPGGPAGAGGSVQAPQALPLAGRVVALDPGHQLGNSRFPRQVGRLVWVGFWKPCNTTGTATDGGFPEATFTWLVTQALRTRLEALGATVRMTRTTNSRADWGPCVDDRGRYGGKVGADVAISVHGDGAAPGTRGFFVIRPGWRQGYTDDVLRPSERLADSVKAGLLGAGLRPSTAYGGDGLDVRRDLGTLNMADVPTVLVELGNMRNAADARCMTSAACRDRYARGLADGVLAMLNPRAGTEKEQVGHRGRQADPEDDQRSQDQAGRSGHHARGGRRLAADARGPGG